MFLEIADAAANSTGSATTSIIVTALSAGGVGAVLAAIVAGLFSKKKLGAEATEIITKAAAGVVSDLRAELDRVIAARRSDTQIHDTEMLAMAQAHAKERAAWRRVLQLHVAWDAIAIAKLGEIGINLPPAPPLSPAERFVGDDGFPLPVD
jgi:hypothetical protein